MLVTSVYLYCCEPGFFGPASQMTDETGYGLEWPIFLFHTSQAWKRKEIYLVNESLEENSLLMIQLRLHMTRTSISF